MNWNKTISNFEKDVIQSVSDTGGSEQKKLQVLPVGDKPMTFWLPVQMLYHWAIGDSSDLRPLN